jgi:hypothetical protein
MGISLLQNEQSIKDGTGGAAVIGIAHDAIDPLSLDKHGGGAALILQYARTEYDTPKNRK